MADPCAGSNPCFDGDPLDGYTAIDLPSDQFLAACFDVDILNTSGQPLFHNVDADEPFKVRFRAVLTGDIWVCVSGDWCFDLGFTAIGELLAFKLSDKIGKDRLCVRGWRGCDTLCIQVEVDVLPNTVPSDKLYEVGGWFELRCCADGPVVVAGYEPLEERFFFK